MRFPKLPIPYKYTILIGFGVGVLFALRSYLMILYWGEMKFVFQRHALVPIVNYTLWGLLMPPAYYFISRYRVGKEAGLVENLKAFGASLLMSAVHESSSNVIYYLPMHLLGLEPFTGKILQFIIRAFPSAFITRFIEYWILYAVVMGLEFQRRYRDKQLELAQLESRLSSARLNALRLQLQPHFLFNTLNTISSLMEISVKDAQKIVSQLGNLLRTVLDTNRRSESTLREELEFVRSYLNIEQVRFQDRLGVLYKIEEDAMSCEVPALVLQPLVENAVKHGFANRSAMATIEVEAYCQNERLFLTVRDDGRGSAYPPEELMTQAGTGLRNLRERLDLLYKTDYQLTIDTQPGRGFAVTLQLPCITNRAL